MKAIDNATFNIIASTSFSTSASGHLLVDELQYLQFTFTYLGRQNRCH